MEFESHIIYAHTGINCVAHLHCERRLNFEFNCRKSYHAGRIRFQDVCVAVAADVPKWTVIPCNNYVLHHCFIGILER